MVSLGIETCTEIDTYLGLNWCLTVIDVIRASKVNVLYK
jgi:hypothetical protein